jgi:AraC family transcriptional activator FtrA
MDWVRSHPAQPHTLGSLSRRAAMSTRTLQRELQQATRLSPMEWLVRERVAVAMDLRSAGRASMTEVAERAGFGSEESFRRHFKRVARLSPSLYRKQLAARRA